MDGWLIPRIIWTSRYRDIVSDLDGASRNETSTFEDVCPLPEDSHVSVNKRELGKKGTSVTRGFFLNSLLRCFSPACRA